VDALAGSLGEDYQRLCAEGIGAAFSLVPGPLSLWSRSVPAPRWTCRRGSG